LFTLDIGGEGRHPEAWTLNPSSVKTLGPDKGTPIPRWIRGRAESMPLPSRFADCIIVERTPLRGGALEEILRVIALHGVVVLRHVPIPTADRHERIRRYLRARIAVTRRDRVGGQWVQETRLCDFKTREQLAT
jgi:hypothetical protein